MKKSICAKKINRFLKSDTLVCAMMSLFCISMSAIGLASGVAFYGNPESLITNGLVPKNPQITNLFIPNPGVVNAKGNALGFARSQMTSVQKGNITGDTFSTDFRSDVSQSITYVGLASALGSGLFLGVTGGLNEFKSENTNSNSRYVRVPAIETQKDKDVSLKLAAEMTPGFWAGAVVRYSARRGDILGSFSTNEGDRTGYSGSLYGVGMGGSFKTPSALLGLSYFTPKKGKVTLLGETKVTSDPGFLGADAFVDASSTLRLGVVWQYFFYDRDELRLETTSRIAQTRIFPRGIFFEREMYPLQKMGISGEWVLFKKISTRMLFERETHLWEFSDDSEINKVTDEKNRHTVYRGRLGLVLQEGGMEAEVAMGYSKRKFNPFLFGGAKVSASGEDKNLIIQISASL